MSDENKTRMCPQAITQRKTLWPQKWSHYASGLYSCLGWGRGVAGDDTGGGRGGNGDGKLLPHTSYYFYFIKCPYKREASVISRRNDQNKEKIDTAMKSSTTYHHYGLISCE